MNEYVGKHDFVVATVCVRRRPWAAAGWVAAMAAQSRRPDGVLVVLDDPGSEDIESWGLLGGPTKLARCLDIYPHPSAPGWHRGTRESGWKEVPEGVAGRYSDDQHAHLARLRNWTVERALELWPSASHVWCCDSDIQPESDVLELLLRSGAERDVIAAVVRNSAQSFNFMLGWDEGGPRRHGNEAEVLSRYEAPPGSDYLTAVIQVSMTGACALYSREALDRGLRWEPHKNGEDCALAIKARELGVSLWVEPRARCAHFMNGPDQEPLR